jgi:glycosyltransferase involved in cell wall biosynthesis
MAEAQPGQSVLAGSVHPGLSVLERPARRRLRVGVLLKTNSGGTWILPQVEEMRRRGHQVIVIVPPGTGCLTDQLHQRGFEVVESPFDFAFRPTVAMLRGLWRLRALLRRLRPDVLQYHLYASALAARLSTLGLPLRRVHMVAGPLYLESPLIRPVERLLWRLDHVTICGTAFTSKLYGTLGCPPDRRPVATYGVDTDHFDPAGDDESAPRRRDPGRLAERRAKVRAEFGVAEDAFLVVMIAYVYPPKRLVHRGRGIKGHDVLLEAWQRFRSHHPRAHLLLVGGGWGSAGEAHREDLVTRFALTADPSVTWLATTHDVRPCYLAADVSVSPSLSEGHGAAIEASAMAIPSIVSDAGGLPEAVEEHSGWIVPRADAKALALALESAYREFEAGHLAARGTHARVRTVDLFDERTAAVTVADLVERSAGKVARG